MASNVGWRHVALTVVLLGVRQAFAVNYLVTIHFTLLPHHPSFNDVNSDAFAQNAQRIEQRIAETFEDIPGVIHIRILKIESTGRRSSLVTMKISSPNNQDENIEGVLRVAIERGFLGPYSVDSEDFSIREEETDEALVPETSSESGVRITDATRDTTFVVGHEIELRVTVHSRHKSVKITWTKLPDDKLSVDSTVITVDDRVNVRSEGFGDGVTYVLTISGVQESDAGQYEVIAEGGRERDMRLINVFVVQSGASAAQPPTDVPQAAQRRYCPNDDDYICRSRNCLPVDRRCDGVRDCPNGGDDEDNCDEWRRNHPQTNRCDDRREFTCRDGSCIDIRQKCNQQYDCADGSDEQDCATRGSSVSVHGQTCGGPEFQCGDGSCIDIRRRCDSRRDCPDNSDERDCPRPTDNSKPHPSICTSITAPPTKFSDTVKCFNGPLNSFQLGYNVHKIQHTRDASQWNTYLDLEPLSHNICLPWRTPMWNTNGKQMQRGGLQAYFLVVALSILV